MIFNWVYAFCRKLLGIELERRTDLVAVTAFLLSILAAGVSASYLVYGFIKGAKVDMFFVYDQVLIIKEPLNNKDYVAISETVAFNNSGEIGYNMAVKKVTLTLKFSDNSEYKLRWHEFVTFIKKENDQLEKGPAEPAVPLQITAGNVLSKDIYFIPFRKRCEDGKDNCKEWDYLTWEDFLKKLKIGKKIDFTITAEPLDDDVLNSSCTVNIDENLINKLKKNGWQSPSCY